MKHRALQDLIGRAIVDRSFRDQLVNGDRERVIAEFNLSEDERHAINSIDAHNFEALAGKLNDWLEVRHRSSQRGQSSFLRRFK